MAEKTPRSASPTRPLRALPSGASLLLVMAAATISLFGLYCVRSFFGPAFFALTLVLTVRPIYRSLVRRGAPAWVGASASLATLILILLLMLALMISSLSSLPDVIAGYWPKVQDLGDQGIKFLASHGFDVSNIYEEALKQFDFSKVWSTISTGTSAVTSFASSFTGFLGVAALSLLFLTMDMMSMRARASVVRAHDSTLFHALASFEKGVRQYWIVSTVFGLIVAVINGIVLVFLGVPMPLAWALFSFITNYIPNIGFIIGVIPPALMGGIENGWLTAVWVVVAFSVINGVIQGIFQPKIAGDAVGLSTSITFISLMFWTVVIGPLGSILAVPLTLLVKSLLVESSVRTRWIGAFVAPESEVEKEINDGYFGSEAQEELAATGIEKNDAVAKIREHLTLRRQSQVSESVQEEE